MIEKKAIPLRISVDLHKEIKAWAEQDLRSVNGQIELILREAIQKRKGQSAKQNRKVS